MERMPEYRRELVRELRRRDTRTEQILWRHIRGRQCGGLKFRRQHPLGRYVADFFCEEARLVVEIDGLYHSAEDRIESDQIRDDTLRALGCRVVRFTVDEVLDDLPGVVGRILEAAGGAL